MVRLVHLEEFDGLGLIVKAPTAIAFTNQVGGLGCFHPEQEGVFVPLPVKVGRPEIHALQQHFRGKWHSLAEEDAAVVDGILRRNDIGYLSADRTLLAESFEAWIHVVISPQGAADLFEAPEWVAGVLTWANSD